MKCFQGGLSFQAEIEEKHPGLVSSFEPDSLFDLVILHILLIVIELLIVPLLLIKYSLQSVL